MRSLAVQGTRVRADQARVEPALVDEDQPGRVDGVGLLPPCDASCCHVHSILLAGPERLCLRTQPSCFSARQITGVLRRSLLDNGRAREADLTLDDLGGGFLIGNALRGLMRARLA